MEPAGPRSVLLAILGSLVQKVILFLNFLP